MKKRTRKNAFTLVELVVVMAVIAIISSILVPTFGRSAENQAVKNDTVTLRSLNTSLALYVADGYKINDERDIKRAIDLEEGKGYFDALKPTSAKYGYHYWWDENTEQIVLAKADGLNPEEIVYSFSKRRKERQNSTALETSFFKTMLQMTGGYFLLERTGSGLAEILATLSSPKMTASDYEKAVKGILNLDKTDHDEALKEPLQNLLETTAFISDNGVFRSEKVENVKNIIFANSIATVVNSLTTFSDGGEIAKSFFTKESSVATLNADGIEPLVNLPDTVKRVDGNALNLGEETFIKVALTESQLNKVFTSSATNSKIILEEGEETYKIVNNRIEKTNADSSVVVLDGVLEHRNTVRDFTLYQDGAPANEILFFALEKLPETMELSAEEFIGTNPEEPIPDTTVTWESNDENVTVDENGVVRFENPAMITKNSVVITAKSNCVLEDFPVEKTLTVNVVRVTSFTLNETSIYKEILPGKEFSTTLSARNFTYNFPTANERADCDETLVYESNNQEVCSVDQDGKLTFVGYGEAKITVSLKNNANVQRQISVIFEELVDDILIEKFDGDFLYRVGNENGFNLSLLFGIRDDVNKTGISYNISVYDASFTDGDGVKSLISTFSGDPFLGSENFFQGVTDLDIDYQFFGTGVAIVEVKAIKKGKAFQTRSTALEVVDGKNVDNCEEDLPYDKYSVISHNAILLQDVTLPEGENNHLFFKGASLYGNGFALDVTKGAIKGESDSQNYLVKLTDATLDNVKIKGAVYSTLGATAKSDYNNALVLVHGNAVVANSVLSNCATPIRVIGVSNLTVKNTLLRGGCFANMDIRGGNVTLENVTTVNNAKDNDKSADGRTIVGFGIVGYYENVANDTKLKLVGKIKQYNYVSESDKTNVASVKNGADYVGLLFEKIFGLTDKVHLSPDGEKWINTGIFSLSGDSFNASDFELADHQNEDNYEGEIKTFSANVLGVDLSVNTYLYLPAPEAPTYYGSGEFSGAYEFIKPVFSTDFSSQTVEKVDGAKKYLYVDENGDLHVGVSEGQDVSVDFLSALTCKKYGLDLVVNGEVPTKTYATADVGKHRVRLTATDVYFFDQRGNALEQNLARDKFVNVFVEITTWKNAEISVAPGKAYWMKAGTILDADWNVCIPIATGITVTDYDQDGTPTTIVSDGSKLPDGVSYAVDFNVDGPSFANGQEEIVKNGILYAKTTKAANDKTEVVYTVTFTYTGNNGVSVSTTATYVLDLEREELPS